MINLEPSLSQDQQRTGQPRKERNYFVPTTARSLVLGDPAKPLQDLVGEVLRRVRAWFGCAPLTFRERLTALATELEAGRVVATTRRAAPSMCSPQSPQNFRPLGFSKLQLGQRTGLSLPRAVSESLVRFWCRGGAVCRLVPSWVVGPKYRCPVFSQVEMSAFPPFHRSRRSLWGRTGCGPPLRSGA
jgi:hypothetical protein